MYPRLCVHKSEPSGAPATLARVYLCKPQNTIHGAEANLHNLPAKLDGKEKGSLVVLNGKTKNIFHGQIFQMVVLLNEFFFSLFFFGLKNFYICS